MADEKDTKQEEEQAEEKEETTEEKEEEVTEEKKEETTEETPEDTDEEVEVPAKFKDIVESVENMTVLELNELVKVIEKKFGVSAQAVAVAAPGAGAGNGAEEKDEFTVELASAGDSKIGVIKAVKAALGLGLKEAKDLVESAPAVLKENVKKEEAEEMKSAIEEAGGKVELK